MCSETVKPDQRVRWSKRENALLYCFERDKSTSMLIAYALETVEVHTGGDGIARSLAVELDRRGYDLTTLRLSIRMKSEMADVTGKVLP